MALDHGAEKKLGEMCTRREVELNLAETFFQRDLCKLAKHAVSGVVHQNIHDSALAFQLVKHKLRSRCSGKVERDGFGRDSKLALKFIGKLRELGRAASNQNEVVMVFGKELGQFVSDAAGRTVMRAVWFMAGDSVFLNRIKRRTHVTGAPFRF